MAAVLHLVGVVVGFVLLALVGLLFVPFRWRPVGLYLFVPKVVAGAFTPFLAATGLPLALAGAFHGSWWVAMPAGLASLGAVIVIVRLGLLRPELGDRVRSGLGAADPDRTSIEDGEPVVARPAPDCPRGPVAAGCRVRNGARDWPGPALRRLVASSTCSSFGWRWSTCTAAPTRSSTRTP